MIETIKSLKTWCGELPSFLTGHGEHLAIIVHPNTEIAYGGWEDDLNLDWCKEHDIPVYNQNRNGGTIVCAEGNIEIGFVYDNTKYKVWVLTIFMRDLISYFANKDLQVSYDHNDILIDGYKVASGCGYNLPLLGSEIILGMR